MDESYTPSKVSLKAGSSHDELQVSNSVEYPDTNLAVYHLINKADKIFILKQCLHYLIVSHY